MLQLFGGFWANSNKLSKLHLKAEEVACEEQEEEGGKERGVEEKRCNIDSYCDNYCL